MNRLWPVWVVGLVGVAMVNPAAAGAPPPLPGPEVLAAFDRLSEPSHPQPLPGDLQVTADRFAHAGSCTDLGPAYQESRAPLPSGATVSIAGSRSPILVAAPFGPSAILTEDQPDNHRCVYTIATEPTITLDGAGVTLGGGYLNVGCVNFLGVDLLIAEFDNKGVVTSLLASQQNKPEWVISIVPGALVDVMKLSGDQQVPGMVRFTGSGTFDGATLTFTGTGPTGPMTARLLCTPFTALPS